MGFWGNFLILIVDADSETYFTVSFNKDVEIIINKINQNRHTKGIHFVYFNMQIIQLCF